MAAAGAVMLSGCGTRGTRPSDQSSLGSCAFLDAIRAGNTVTPATAARDGARIDDETGDANPFLRCARRPVRETAA